MGPSQITGGQSSHQRQLTCQHRGAEDLSQTHHRMPRTLAIRMHAEHVERLTLGCQSRATAHCGQGHVGQIYRRYNPFGTTLLNAGDAYRRFTHLGGILARGQEECRQQPLQLFHF